MAKLRRAVTNLTGYARLTCMTSGRPGRRWVISILRDLLLLLIGPTKNSHYLTAVSLLCDAALCGSRLTDLKSLPCTPPFGIFTITDDPERFR